MRELPILFSAPMIRALLDGSKTQTRRIVKMKTPKARTLLDYSVDGMRVGPCRYGNIGDRLWVRETHFINDFRGARVPQEERADVELVYAATDVDYVRNLEDDEGFAWRPSIHMPRWASRITLEITGVRVERLNGISDADAIAEGVERSIEYPTCWKRGKLHGDQNTVSITGFPKLAFRSLWEEINGFESWAANPWVWVIEFKRLNHAD